MSIESVIRQLFGFEGFAAVHTVADAARLARLLESEGATGTLFKADASPVTVADFAVQALAAARLAVICPDVPLVAEEDATRLRGADAAAVRDAVFKALRRFDPTADATRTLQAIDRGGGRPVGRFWTLDPIDGTRGLLRGGQYVVALALIQEGRVQMGILGCPRLTLRGCRFANTASDVYGSGGIAVAARDRGAWWVLAPEREITRLTVSTIALPARARVLHSVESAHSDLSQLTRVLGALDNHAEPLWMDSQAKHVVLAAGRADLLLRFPTSTGCGDAIWDHAAGSLLVEEAGGRVTDLAGHPLDFSTGRRVRGASGLVASNGWLHDAVLKAIGGVYTGSETASVRPSSAAI